MTAKYVAISTRSGLTEADFTQHKEGEFPSEMVSESHEIPYFIASLLIESGFEFQQAQAHADFIKKPVNVKVNDYTVLSFVPEAA